MLKLNRYTCDWGLTELDDAITATDNTTIANRRWWGTLTHEFKLEIFASGSQAPTRTKSGSKPVVQIISLSLLNKTILSFKIKLTLRWIGHLFNLTLVDYSSPSVMGPFVTNCFYNKQSKKPKILFPNGREFTILPN